LALDLLVLLRRYALRTSAHAPIWLLETPSVVWRQMTGRFQCELWRMLPGCSGTLDNSVNTESLWASRFWITGG
jgi:hypothetical protein